ncbi:MAG: hypothetical protein CMP07_09420 [Xanthomonadales bacterium]|nr:hypothetical protein [Xanthomonadales bacterium]
MKGARLRVLHVVAGLHPDHGGPSRTVVSLADSIAADPDWDVRLLTQARRGSPVVEQRSVAVRRTVAVSPSPLLCSLGVPALRQLERDFSSDAPVQLLHIHGVWAPAVHWACRAARARQIPYLLQPRGMLEPWALNYRAWKKLAAMRLYQWRDLASAAVLVATASEEAENLRKLGLVQPIAVIPNGVDFSDDAGDAGQDRASGASQSCRIALFLSRIHPKKNLKTLIEAWAALAPAGWELHIAGPDEGGHRREIENLVRKLSLEDQVTFLGSLDDVERSRAYAQADLFILPSFSENFGVVVAEAMSHGLPVIATHGTPWSAVEDRGCGWWVAPDLEGLTGALAHAFGLDQASLCRMGARAREYAKEFAWEKIGRQTVAVYRWVLGSAQRPGCVVLE